MGVPLAALAIRPPEQQPSALDQYSKFAQLRQMQQEAPLRQQALQQNVQAGAQDIQMKQQQMKDQQAVTKAMQGWDGRDLDELPSMVLKQGGSAQAVFGLKNSILDQKEKLTKLDSETLANTATKNDQVLGKLQSVTSDPDDSTLGQRINATAQDAVKSGLIDPQHAQQLQQLTANTQDPKALRQQLDIFEKSLMGQKEIFAQEQKSRETGAAVTTAEARKQAADTGQQKFTAELPGGALNKVTQEQQIATNPAIQGAKVDLVQKEAAARAAAEAAIAKQGNDALTGVPKQLIGPATAAAQKANKEQADAKSVSDRMKATMDAARSGNVVSYQIIPEEGTLQITTSQGVHRINKTEIEQYAGGGSLWQRMEGHFGKQLSGQSIPKSVLDDMAQIQDIQAKGAKSRYENTLKSINQTYGSGFKPVEMGGLDSDEPQSDGDKWAAKYGGKVRANQ